MLRTPPKKHIRFPLATPGAWSTAARLLERATIALPTLNRLSLTSCRAGTPQLSLPCPMRQLPLCSYVKKCPLFTLVLPRWRTPVKLKTRTDAPDMAMFPVKRMSGVLSPVRLVVRESSPLPLLTAPRVISRVPVTSLLGSRALRLVTQLLPPWTEGTILRATYCPNVPVLGP